MAQLTNYYAHSAQKISKESLRYLVRIVLVDPGQERDSNLSEKALIVLLGFWVCTGRKIKKFAVPCV